MDLAWRQVALDEREGRLPEVVAETETEKRMEALAERARRSRQELRRIRQLNRGGNDAAYLDALGEYLRSYTREGKGKQKKKDAKKKNAVRAASNAKKRRKVDRSSASASDSARKLGLGGDESSDASGSSSESSTSIASISSLKKKEKRGAAAEKTTAVGSNKENEAMELLSSASSSGEENEGSAASLGSMLQLKWRGTAELESLAKKHRRSVLQVRMVDILQVEHSGGLFRFIRGLNLLAYASYLHVFLSLQTVFFAVPSKQFKATYHNSDKSIRDTATASPANSRGDKIRPRDLIIKLRSAHPLNGSSETVCSFTNWALPGTSGSLKPVISESVRRGSSVGLGGSRRRGATHAPPLFLDRDLSFEDKAKVRSFLTDASPGSTPLQFFSRSSTSSKKNLQATRGSPMKKDSKDQSVWNEGNQASGGVEESRGIDDTSSQLMGKDQVNEFEYTSTIDAGASDRAGLKSSSENEPSSRNRKLSSSSGDRRRSIVGRTPSDVIKCNSTAGAKETNRPIQSGSHNTSGHYNLTPRTRTARATAKKKRKHEEIGDSAEAPSKEPSKRTYDSRNRNKNCHRPITFSCNELPGSDAGTASCFGIIEGVSGGASELEHAESHPLDQYLPFRGRIVEAPGSVRVGNWTGQIVQDDDPSRILSSSSALLRDTVADLRGIRIELRHHDAKAYGPLKNRFTSDSSLTFSVFNPRLSRTQGFRNQRVLDEDEIDKIVETDGRRCGGPDAVPFVGSISLALLGGGFHSISEENDQGAKLAEDHLDGVRLLADKERFKRERFQRNDLLPVCSIEDPNETVAGISFPCRIECANDYWVILAQNEESQAIEAVDVVFQDPNLVQDEHSLTLESGTSVSSMSGSTRTAARAEVVLPLTADNLVLHDHEQEEMANEHDDEEEGSSSSERSSSLATSRTPFADLSSDEENDDDCQHSGDELVTPKARDEAKVSAHRTGTTRPLSSIGGGSGVIYPPEVDNDAPTQQSSCLTLSTNGGDCDEEEDEDRASSDFLANSLEEDAGATEEQMETVAIGTDSEVHDGNDAEAPAASPSISTCNKDNSSSLSKALPGSAVLEVEWAEDLDHSGEPARQLTLSRVCLSNQCNSIRGGTRGKNDFTPALHGSNSKLLEVYEVPDRRSVGQIGVVIGQGDASMEPDDIVVLRSSPSGSAHPEMSSIESAEYPMPMDTPPRPPSDDDNLSSCDWEFTPPTNSGDGTEEEVFSTPGQPRYDDVIPDANPAQTTPMSTPSFFLTPKVNSSTATRSNEANGPSPQELDLAHVLVAEAEAENENRLEKSPPSRPWMVHSVIFGAQDVATPSSSSSPTRRTSMEHEPEVLSTIPFYLESPGALAPTKNAETHLPAHAIIYGGQDLDVSGNFLSPQNPALIKEKTVLVTLPFYLESPRASQETLGGGEEHCNTNLLELSPKTPQPPRAFHSLLYGQRGSPEEYLSPQNPILCKQPNVLATLPFFFESPNSDDDEGCIGKDIRTIFFGAQSPELSSPGRMLDGSESVFTKQPGNILARPIFMSSSSYEEDEEYYFKPTTNLREVVYGGTENNEIAIGSLDTSEMNLETEPESCVSPFFIELCCEAEERSPQKPPRNGRRWSKSTPASFRCIRLLLGAALLLTSTSTPPTHFETRASLKDASVTLSSLNPCLQPSSKILGKALRGNLRSF